MTDVNIFIPSYNHVFGVATCISKCDDPVDDEENISIESKSNNPRKSQLGKKTRLKWSWQPLNHSLSLSLSPIPLTLYHFARPVPGLCVHCGCRFSRKAVTPDENNLPSKPKDRRETGKRGGERVRGERKRARALPFNYSMSLISIYTYPL